MSSGHPIGETFEFFNLFPVSIDGEDAVIDMSAIVHYATIKHAVEDLTATKRAEMTDDARHRFKWKLSTFFGRP